jgi:cytochrome c oxidase subunit I
MTMMRMPLTVWSWFITAILGAAGLRRAAFGGHSLLLDRNLGTSFFMCRWWWLTAR